ncbi:TPA: PKD domain-containing protein [Thermoplasmata archaeon]|nr:PKD domain-containing protein [Thermoplasmata archaeon]
MFSSRPFAALVLIVLLFSSFSLGSALMLDEAPAGGDEQELSAGVLAVNFTELKATPTRVYVGEPVTFYANASSDNPGATMTITIYYDYFLADGSTVNPSSPVSVNVTSTPARVVTTFTYDHIGNASDASGTYFFVRMAAYDGATTSTKSTKVYVVDNTAPILLSKPPATLWPTYQVPLNVTYLVKDWDAEMVSVVWDFGDGSDPGLNESLATPTGVYVRQSHTWVVVPEPGRGEYEVQFNMSVSFEDAVGHLVYSNHTVKIVMPFNTEPDFYFTASSLYAAPDEEMHFYASAMDPEGDPITWTFVFNNSVEDYLVQVYHTDPTEPNATVWQNTTHAFPSLGDYSVTLYISDAYPPYQVDYHNISQTILIKVTDNRPPGVLASIAMTPTEPRISSSLGYVNVTFSIQANDIDGDVLSLSWSFGDGGTATNTSSGGIQVYTFRQTHQYTVAGAVNVSVLVDDGHGHTVLRYRLVSILTDNRAPRLVSLNLSMSNGVFALPGTPVNVTIVISDAEMDPISLWADFGDGSATLSVNLTEFTLNKTVSTALSHIYNRTGEYNITIRFTDGVYGGTHNVTLNYVVEVRVPRISSIRIWNWWDYASLSLVFVGIGMVMLRWYFIGRFRKELDTKGLTLEEYKVMVRELKEIRNSKSSELRAAVRAGKMDSTRAKEKLGAVAAEYKKARTDLRAGKRVEIDTGA